MAACCRARHVGLESLNGSYHQPLEMQDSGKRKLLPTLAAFNWKQWLALTAFILVLGFTGLHVVRIARELIYWQYHRDEEIRGWMTIGYVAHSYRVPPHVLQQALGLPDRPDRRPLREIAKSQNRSMDEIRAILQDAITHARPPNPPPSPPRREGGGR